MFRFCTVLIAFVLLTASATAQSTTIKAHGRGQLTFTSMTQNPATGMIEITGVVRITGTFGVVRGVDRYEINPVTGTYVGAGTRVAPDGSTYEVQFLGQFINATDSVGSYTTLNGTGRFAGGTGTGQCVSSRWASGLGSSNVIRGTSTIAH